MRIFSRFFALSFFSVFVGGAFAAEVCTVYQFVEAGKVIAGPGPADQVCSQVASIMTSRETSMNCNYGQSYCTYSGSYQNDSCVLTRNPGGTTQAVGLDKVSGPCGDACKTKAATTTTINWTVGYTRTPNIDADSNWKLIGPPVVVPQDGGICEAHSSCKVQADYSGSMDAWQSLHPTAEGTYRLSLDFPATYTGDTCLPTALDNAGTSQKEPIPRCPGFVGEVNGVKGCYGTAANPTSADPAVPKPKPPQAGNPAAGEKPSTGEGSGTGGAGRTPLAGDGGPAGGPAGAAGSGSGTKPDGTIDKPGEGKEQANCGAPGQPKCGIDESGTPSKFEGKGDLLSGWEEGVKTNRATIEKSGTGVFDSFNVFFSAPPLVGCEPIELPNDQAITRHCDVVDGTRSVMAYIWALTALWLCVGWIREAI